MKTKRLLSILFVLCLSICLLAVTVSATEIVAIGTSGENLTWELTDDGVLTISGTGEMANDSPWYPFREQIKKVIAEEGITSIGMLAFYEYTNLEEVSLPGTVEYISDLAFADSGITSLVIPEGVKDIGNSAFSGCIKLKSLKLPSTLEWIHLNAFDGCTSLTDIDMSGCKNDLSGYGTFVDCDSLTNLDFYTSTIIGQFMFASCDGFTTLTIPEGVTQIQVQAFSGCNNLQEITFPSTLEEIMIWAFSHCENLSVIRFTGDVPVTSEDSPLFDGMEGEGGYPPIKATAYYPANNSTWTEEARAAMGGEITWVPYSVLPTEVKASNVSSTGKIKVSWNKVDGAAKYKVYRATSKNGTYSLLKTTTGTSLTNTSANAGKTYYYYVVAVAEDGTTSDKSNIVNRTCDLARPTVTLSNVASTGKIKVSWEKVDGAVKYEVYRATSKNGTYTKLITTTKTSITNSSAVAGKTYYYKVKAIASKSAANSAYSSVKSRVCDLARPDVTVELNTKGKPVVDWDKISGATKYKVYIYSSSGKLLKTVTTTGTKLTHSSAVKSTTYNYRIVAVASNSSANSAKSVKDTIKSK